jgi:hypothetical protein
VEVRAERWQTCVLLLSCLSKRNGAKARVEQAKNALGYGNIARHKNSKQRSLKDQAKAKVEAETRLIQPRRNPHK